jgi:hypothetical protein
VSPTPKPTPDLSLAGRYVPSTTSASHVRAGTDIRYSSRPPTSGRHYAQTAGYGVFERDVAAGNWVHTLEHGGIVLLYRPDLCDAACQDGLRAIYSQAPASQSFNVVKIAVIPYQDMDHAIAAAAWEWLDEMDSLDAARILKFYGDHLDKGPEQAL